jgi:A/G-specific adenine glycosylase
MRSEDVAYALALRQTGSGWEVLLVQRDMTLSVMPGLWELPSLRNPIVPETDVRMKLRHAIMQVNYRVTIREVAEEQVAAETFPAAIRRWMPLSGLDSLPMTGLARKVLRRIRPPGSSDA